VGERGRYQEISLSELNQWERLETPEARKDLARLLSHYMCLQTTAESISPIMNTNKITDEEVDQFNHSLLLHARSVIILYCTQCLILLPKALEPYMSQEFLSLNDTDRFFHFLQVDRNPVLKKKSKNTRNNNENNIIDDNNDDDVDDADDGEFEYMCSQEVLSDLGINIEDFSDQKSVNKEESEEGKEEGKKPGNIPNLFRKIPSLSEEEKKEVVNTRYGPKDLVNSLKDRLKKKQEEYFDLMKVSRKLARYKIAINDPLNQSKMADHISNSFSH